MDMNDFFFQDASAARHLRKISQALDRNVRHRRTAAATARRAVDEVEEVRNDVRFLALVLTAILKRLTENKTMSLVDVTDLINDIDGLDGLSDTGLDPGVLRGLLGIVKEEVAQETESEAEQINIVTEPTRFTRYRYR